MAKKIAIEQTEIEAPYELPEGWKWVKIGDIAEIINGKNQKDVEDENGVYPIYGSGGIIGKARNFICPENCTIIGRKGTINNPIFVETKFWNVDTAFGMKTFDCVNPKFYFYFCKSYNFTTLDSSTAIPSLTKTNIQQIPFPLPPTLAEQERIVNRIEKMFAKLDQAQEKAQAVLDSFETRKAAILHKAFTGQLRIDNEELTMEDWEEKKLEDVLIEKPRNGYSTTAVDYETPYKTMSLSATTSGYFRPEFCKYIEADISDDSFLWLKPGDILIQRANSLDKVGTSAIYTGGEHEFIYPDLMMKLQVKETISNAFIAYQLKTEESLAYFRNNATGTAGNMPKINQKTVCNLPIKLPPLNYQLSIVNFLDTVLEKESRAKEAAQTVLDQIALLKKSILARAFRGEL